MRGKVEAREMSSGTWMAVGRGLAGKASIDGRTWEPAFPQFPGASCDGCGLNTSSGVCALLVCQAWASCHLWSVHRACRKSALTSPRLTSVTILSVGHRGQRCTQPHHGLYRAGDKPRKRGYQLLWFVMKQGVISDIARSRVPSINGHYFPSPETGSLQCRNLTLAPQLFSWLSANDDNFALILTTDPGESDRSCLGYMLKALAMGRAEGVGCIDCVLFCGHVTTAGLHLVWFPCVELKGSKGVHRANSTKSWGPLSAVTGPGGGLECGWRTSSSRWRTEGSAAEEGTGKARRQGRPGYSLR